MAALELRELAWATDRQLTCEVEHGKRAGLVVPDPGERRRLARTLAGLEKPSAGSVLVAGRDLTVELPDALPDARWIGHLVVGAELLPHLTVEENIRYGLHGPLHVQSLIDAEVAALVEQLDLVLKDRFREPLPHLITAERRFRTGLARAALRSPGAIVVEVPDGVESLGPPEDFERAVLPGDERPAIVLCVGSRKLLAPDDKVELAPPPPPGEGDEP